MSSDGPGQREVAYRLFAAEYDDANYSYSESNEERAPNYVVTPTGARVNRLFAAGVLTEVERVNDEMLRGRVADPTGAFVLYAGQYEPDEQAALERTDPPAFVAVTGKANTFEPDDGDRVYTSIRPESINTVDAETRDRWTVQAAEQTVTRVGHAAAALSTGLAGDELRDRLDERGVDPALADGITRALAHYGTTPAYLDAVRRLALDTARVVAGQRNEAQELTLAPDDSGDVTAADLLVSTPDAGSPDDSTDREPTRGTTGVGSSSGTGETRGDRDERADSEPAGSPSSARESNDTVTSDSTAAGETDTTTATGDIDSSTENAGTVDTTDDETDRFETTGTELPDSTTTDRVDSTPDDLPDSAVTDRVDSTPDDLPGDTTADGTGESEFVTDLDTSAGGNESDEIEKSEDPVEFGESSDSDGFGESEDSVEFGESSDPGEFGENDDPGGFEESSDSSGFGESEGLGEFEGGDFELSDEVREEVDEAGEEFGAGFQSGTEVDDPGEAGIPTPEPETEPVADPVDSATDAESADDPNASNDGVDVGEGETGADETEEVGDTSVQTDEEETAGDGTDETQGGIDDPQEAVLAVMTELDDGSGADYETVVTETGERHGFDDETIEDAIESALMGGKCYEPDESSLKPI